MKKDVSCLPNSVCDKRIAFSWNRVFCIPSIFGFAKDGFEGVYGFGRNFVGALWAAVVEARMSSFAVGWSGTRLGDGMKVEQGVIDVGFAAVELSWASTILEGFRLRDSYFYLG